MALRLRIYQKIAGAGFRIFSNRSDSGGSSILPAASCFEGKQRAWFHAASAGELESLWPVIERWCEDGGCRAWVTIFSASAEASLKKLSQQLADRGTPLMGAGYSPPEGRWSILLDSFRPDVFVTAKYEAWPDLWASLARRKVPLFIVGALSRRSFQVVKHVLRLLGEALPALTLLVESEADRPELAEIFPYANIWVSGEPRWDRVAGRVRAGNGRARILIEAFRGKLPEPWGILGQVWPEDLSVWKAAISGVKGGLWVVPHSLEVTVLAKLEEQLQAMGLSAVRSSQLLLKGRELTAPSCQAVLVDEMGFLAELYPAASWAFVGGGFGQSIHSTIEPAIWGLPIACGPAGVGRFSEIRSLLGRAQLTVIGDSTQLKDWLKDCQDSVDLERRKLQWRQDAELKLGASERIVQVLLGKTRI